MAYTAEVTFDQPHPMKDKSGDWGWMSGTVDITEYNSTLVEITDITKHFKTVSRVVTELSDECYAFYWNSTDSAFDAYNIQTTLTANTSGNALTYTGGALHATGGGTVDMTRAEATDATDVGAANFVVYGTL